MKFASLEIEDKSTWGVIEGEFAIDVGSVLGSRFPTEVIDCAKWL